MRAIVDPRSKFVYVSYYYFGLQSVFGPKRVVFELEPFLDLRLGSKDFGFDHLVAIIIEPACKRLVIDFGDKHQVNKEALEWCDLYAKINIRAPATLGGLSSSEILKIKQIGPGFGINQLPTMSLGLLAMSNRLKIKNLAERVSVSEKQFFGGYNWARKRLSLGHYESPQLHVDEMYVFHVSQYYVNQAGGDSANDARLRFVKSVTNHPDIRFEGGLVLPADTVNATVGSKYSARQFSTKEYLANTLKSTVVFNTPAAWGCHGWKLGEYLAMGKAIISMPLINDVPPGLVHGENIHVVEGSDSLHEGLDSVISDRSYRLHLESNAREFFKNHLHPEQVIRQLVEILY